MPEENKIWVNGGIGKRVPKTETNRFGWEELMFEEIKIDPNKKTIVYLGGNGSIMSEDANFGAKFVEGLVGKAYENNYDLYSLYYGHEEGRDTGYMSERQRAEFYNIFIKPLVCDEKGKVLDEKTIAKNLGSLRFVTHCKGAEEVGKLLLETYEFLKPTFGDEKAKLLLKNVYNVSYAPYKSAEIGTNFGIVSLKDDKLDFAELDDVMQQDQNEHKLYGIGRLKRCNKNWLNLYSATVVNIENDYSPLIPKNKGLDEHNIALLLKEGGVIDRKWLPNFDFNNLGKKPEGYSRQQAVSDCMGIAVAYGLLHDEVDLDDVAQSVETQIKQEEKTYFEEQQQHLFKEKAAGGREFEKVLKESGFTISDVLNGKVKKQDLKIPASGVKEDGYIAQIVMGFGSTKSGYSDKIVKPDERGYGNGQGVYCEMFYGNKERCRLDVVITQDGTIGYGENADTYAKLNICGKELENSVVMQTSIQHDPQLIDENHITVKIGKRFKNGDYGSIDELKKNIVQSADGGCQLTEEQTRIILNEAVAARVPFSNIKLDNGIKFNQKVLDNEIDIDENELIAPTKIATKSSVEKQEARVA